jgi:predicted nuclease with TOPRIM domain
MNAFQFQLRRLARYFGIRREKQRLASLSRESQFLHEAVDLLGRAAWQDASAIDDLAVEFWQIRDLEKQQLELRTTMETIRGRNAELEARRAEIEGSFNAELEKLKELKIDRMSRALELMKANDAQKVELEHVKRRFAGLKLRLKALEEDPMADAGGNTVSATAHTMEDLKAEYGRVQAGIEARTAELHALEQGTSEVDSQLEAKREELKRASAEIISQLGKSSKELADLAAKVGSLQNSKNALANRIGVYLSRNIDNPSKEIRSVLSKHRELASKIRHFRQSIAYYQRLVRG